MTTAEALEGMRDEGDFEILCTRVLRILDSNCKTLVHWGVNAQGKTIPNSVDGFCLVPGSDPHRYVWTTFTTCNLKSLERKWLLQQPVEPDAKKVRPAEEGDLIKAGMAASVRRALDPGSECIVYLCTNRRLNPELMYAAIAKAAELGVSAEFLDQSRLAPFSRFESGGTVAA